MQKIEGRTIERWPLSRLKPHPRQAELFQDLAGEAFQDLVDSMSRGQDNPVEALPDGTLICGHQRVRAAKQLGWTEIDVWVRNDLQDASAVEERLIEDNLSRRQLDKLDIARCYRRLRQRAFGSADGCDRRKRLVEGDLRDVLAKRLNCSGRNLDRYLRILQTPVEVQNAFSSDKLSLIQAGKVAGLVKAIQQDVAKAIREGGDPAAIVAEAIENKKTPWKRAEDLRREASRIIRTVFKMENIVKVGGCVNEQVTKRLMTARERIDQLIAAHTAA